MERLDDVALSRYKMEVYFYRVWAKILFSYTAIKTPYILTSHHKTTTKNFLHLHRNILFSTLINKQRQVSDQGILVLIFSSPCLASNVGSLTYPGATPTAT